MWGKIDNGIGETPAAATSTQGRSSTSTTNASTSITFKAGDGYSIDTITNTITLTGNVYTVIGEININGSYRYISMSLAVRDADDNVIETKSASWQHDYYSTDTEHLLTIASVAGMFVLPNDSDTYTYTYTYNGNVEIRHIGDSLAYDGRGGLLSGSDFRVSLYYNSGLIDNIRLTFGSHITEYIHSLDPDSYPQYRTENGNFYTFFPSVNSDMYFRATSKYISSTLTKSSTLRLLNPYSLLIITIPNAMYIGYPIYGLFRICNNAYPQLVNASITIDNTGAMYLALPSDIANADEAFSICWL